MIQIKESNVTIMVKDMDKAIAFYQSVGLTLKDRWGDHYAMLTATGVTIGLHPSAGKEHSSGNVSVGFMVDEIAGAKSLLEKNKITFKEEDGKSGTYVHFKDLDGTILYFVKPKWN
jgi:catechol 2,3-dioxygenase-like lactoylglutathione lyase family enzyme